MEKASTHAAVLGPTPGSEREIGLRRRIIEIVQAAEVEAALALLDGGQDLLNAARLLVGDAAAADGVGHLPMRARPRPAPSSGTSP